jgi:hypothetical protein
MNAWANKRKYLDRKGEIGFKKRVTCPTGRNLQRVFALLLIIIGVKMMLVAGT